MTDPNAPAYPNKDHMGDGPNGLTIRQRYAIAFIAASINGRYASGIPELMNVSSSKIIKEGFSIADSTIQFENEEKK